MQAIKELTTGNITLIPLESGYNAGRYITFLAGAGLTAASFLISGGSLALLGSGIMCGVGLKLSIKSIKYSNGWNKLLYDTGLGALNGLISSIGLVCIAQNECNDNIDGPQQLITSYALTGLITGTINGTINEVIYTSNNMKTQIFNGPNNDDIELFNVAKNGFMEMGTNMITAIGKSTLFKSSNHTNSSKLIKIHRASYHPQRDSISHQYYDKIKQNLQLTKLNLVQYRNFSNIHTIHTPKQNKTPQLTLFNLQF